MLAVSLVIGFVIWLLIRGIVLWYFKITDIVDELRKQNETLMRINTNIERTLYPPTGETV